jgi:hypothetical protein
MEDPYWTHDTLLFEGTFRYYRDKKQPVHGKIHISEEDYDFHSFGHGLERSYLKNRKGMRTYFFMRLYIELPNIILSMAVSPKQYTDAGTILGKTTGSRVAGFRHDEIGNAQAWYYPQEKVLVLWECYLDDFTRDASLLQDQNMVNLWTGFEQWLLNRYPETERIVTPYADPIWNIKEYQAFLRARGYTKGRSGTFTKLLK